jgi:hypothetical protein
MAVKLKELQEDVLIDITVNKSYYTMLKHSLHYLFNLVSADEKTAEEYSKLPEKKYEDMTPHQRTFFTITLMVAEIERKAKELNLYNEKEILEPNDEGYVEPTEG